MDDATFRAALAQQQQQQPQAAPEGGPQAAQAPQGQPTAAAQQAQPQAQPQGAPQAPQAPQGPQGPQVAQAPGAAMAQPDGSLGPQDLLQQGRDAIGHPSSFLDAIAGGAAQAAYQTKDFLFGPNDAQDPASATRQAIEHGTALVGQGSYVNSALTTISEFATGMLGAGKLTALSKLPEAAAAVGGLGEWGLSAGKAAAVGAIAFDPHQERLSNLLESVPILSNPVTRWLQASPDDSEAAGRVKSALESIGLDATLSTVFLAAGKLFKAIRNGDQAAIPAATDELQAAQEKAAAADPASQTPADAPGAQVAGEAPAEGANPEAASQTPADAPTQDATALPAEGAAVEQTRLIERPHAAEGEMPEGGVPEGGAEGDAADETQGTPPSSGEADDLHSIIDPQGESSLGTSPPSGVPEASDDARFKPPVIINPEDAEKLVAGVRGDLAAIDDAGSVQGAVDAGHVFGKGAGIPWNKINLPGEVDGFVARVADTISTQMDALKGGDVLSDATVQRQVQGMASYFGLNPASVAGNIAQAGRDANKMVSQMDAAYLISNRMFQDAFALANRIGAGDLSGFVSRADAVLEFQRQASLAASMLASGQSMRAAFGRGMRRMRPEFAIDAASVQAMQQLGGERLMELFKRTLGDPNALKKVVNPTFLQKAASDLGFLVQNNLLWGIATHTVNFLSNGYMLVSRPAQRIVGAVAQGDMAHAAENLRQYTYILTNMRDALGAAWNALKVGDSILSPHGVALKESSHVVGPLQRMAQSNEWRPFDSFANVTYNALHAATYAVGFPVRTMAAADEMMKQLVYRSKVQAQAVSEAGGLNLTGQDFRTYVQQKLDAAFDDAGRGTNKEALQEARVATFAQDLAPGSIGKWVQGGVASHPVLRLIVPFTQTPTNIFRQMVKELPAGAGMAQSEFRNMLMGRMGQEAQQLAIGQTALGTAAYFAIVASGLSMTGGGPADPKVKDQLQATGWKPYSIVFTDDAGTKHFFPIGRIDPLAMPFGIIADIMDYLHQEPDGSSKIQGIASTLFYSLVKQVSNKTYLGGIAHIAQAFTDPAHTLSTATGQTLDSAIPFSSALRNYNPDPYMREARSMMDQIMANTAGLSTTLPARYDALGRPMPPRNAFITASINDPVDREVQRMANLGYAITPATPTINNADLRDVTTQDGKNAWEWYQQLSGKPTPNTRSLHDTVGRMIGTQAYQGAPDGPGNVEGTKLWMLHTPVINYRNNAEMAIQKDPNVRAALENAQRKVQGAYAARNAGVVQHTTNMDIIQSGLKAFGGYLTPSPQQPQ